MIQCVTLREPERWNLEVTRVPHVFGHTWESVRAFGDDTSFLWVARSSRAMLLCPFSVRRQSEVEDLFSPYGFSGFAGQGAIEELEPQWRAFLSSKKFVSGYVAQHPLLPPPSFLDGERRFRATTYSLDLTLPVEMLARRLRGKGMLASYRRWRERQWERDRHVLGAAFLELYPLAMARAGAGRGYLLGAAKLQALLESPRVFWIGVREHGRIVAVSAFGLGSTVAEYLFNAATETARRHSAPLIWAAVDWLQSRGYRRLHLGGGIRPGDGLDHFKSRLGGDAHPYAPLEQVYRSTRFAQLCEELLPAAGRDYFPPYHRPPEG